MNRAVTVLAVSALYAYASACCGVAPNGQPVKFGDQSNIIVWNPETKTEHFVRNAFFDSTAKDSGFIAATPSVPELKEADARAFDLLAGFKPNPHPEYDAAPASADAGKVDVLQQVDVGKYTATTVRSDDPSAMSAYLKQNGYVNNKSVDDWIGFYTKKKWAFTAFKVRKGAEGHAATGVIRMSFKTDEPFNPYYVPEANSVEGGTLKLFFVSDGVYSATIGHSQGWISPSWSNQIHEYSLEGLSSDLGLPTTAFPKNLTVTYFEKPDWLEGQKDDLYFTKESWLTKTILIVLVSAGVGLWWFTRSRKAKMASLA